MLTFDHHCGWVGQCIGQKNHRIFVIFVATQALVAGWTFDLALSAHNSLPPASTGALGGGGGLDGGGGAGGVGGFGGGDVGGVGGFGGGGDGGGVSESALLAMAMVVCFSFTVFLAGLLAFHLFLITTAQTTYEILKRDSIRYLQGIPDNVAVFGAGGYLLNCAHFFCVPQMRRDGRGWELPTAEEVARRAAAEDCCNNRYYSCC